MMVKKRLVGEEGREWAAMPSFIRATFDEEGRTWQSPSAPEEEIRFPGAGDSDEEAEPPPKVYEKLLDGLHYDPGLKSKATLQEKAASLTRHDDREAFRRVL